MTDDVRPFIEIQDRSYARAGVGIRESFPRAAAMDLPRMAAFLDRRRYAVLATGRPDGRPQAAPIAFSVWRGAFWVATVRGARLRNLRARSYASIVAMEGDVRPRHRTVIAEGPVSVHEGTAILDSEPEFGRKWRSRFGSDPAWAAAMLELRPERVFSFDGSLE